MRYLLFAMLAPMLAHSQLDTIVTYRQKHVHNIVIRADSSQLSWNADTINYATHFEIKFNKAKKTIAIDGYGTYKVSKYEIHGAIEPHLPEHGKIPGHHYYELSNGSKLTWIANGIIWEWPIVKKKTQTIIFEID